MDYNEYFAEWLVKTRLAEAGAAAERAALLESLCPRCRPVRVVLGLGLIRAGRWILGQVPEDAGEPDTLPWRQTARP